jgi:hypothetical protein
MRDARRVARTHPTAMFGTALFAGILLGRFLRSSSLPEHEVVFEPDPSLLDPDASIGTLSGSGSFDSGGSLPPSSFGGGPPTGGWA